MSKEIQNLIKGNALKYMRYKDQLETIDQKEIDQFRDEIVFAFESINKQIIDRHRLISDFVIFVDDDPYASLEDMTESIRNLKYMMVTKRNNDSRLLPGDLNLKFRAVHDYLHYLLQQPFNFEGEYKVYQAQKHIHKSKLRRQILYSEVVLQAAYCEYTGSFAPKQKVVL
jgi:hypothetical protein